MMDKQKRSIKALIIDDERLGRDVVRHMLSDHHDIEIIEECSNGKEALRLIRQSNPDLIFLDIKMPGMDGMELAECLDEACRPIIVFVTAYNEFAIQAFEQNAIDYLLKPFDQERFDQMIARVGKRFEQCEEAAFAQKLKGFLSSNSDLQMPRGLPQEEGRKPIDRIVVKESGRVFFVNPEEVDYFEASGNYVALNLDRKTHLVYDTLTKMEQKLDSSKFLRIHRSTIVNLDRVQELQPHFNGEYVVILNSGAKLKLSRSYKEEARAKLGLG